LASQDHQDFRASQETSDLKDNLDPRATVVSLVCRVCQDPSDLLDRKDPRARTERTGSLELREAGALLGWTGPWEQWATLAPLDQGDLLERRASVVLLVNLVLRVLRVLLARATAWTCPP